ncbi:hypothetical protein [Bradyrhizobium sp. Bra78]|uniref:hypothetical protein n=1 Tax=Bradyrhizobium sp. Bra78 TaxID=2926010 RepID=UPI0021C57285|nr:hypothetical protein [Bradyrhizobium sp. Bra78]
MLFHLDLVEQLAAVDRGVLGAAIADLIRAHRLGDHLVVVSRDSASWLQAHVDLSARDTAMLSRISQGYAQTGDLRRRAKIYVDIVAGAPRRISQAGNSIQVSIELLVRYRLLERPLLLVENMDSDGDLYEFLFENHCDLHHGSSVSFDRQHGGGADLAMVFERLARNTKIVCAIVDSDRASPDAPNLKLAQLERLKQQLNWPLCFPTSPPAHEAENLVPLPIVMNLPSGVRNPTNTILLRVSQEEISNGHPLAEQFWLFFDVKEGSTPQKFGRMTENDQAWIISKAKLANIDPSEHSVAGYGDRVIGQVFAENKFKSELRKETRHPNWRDVFAGFLDEIIWVFLAGRKIIT